MSLSMLESYGIIVSLSSRNRPQIFIEKNRAPCSGVCGAASGHRGLMPSSGRSQPHLGSGAGRLPKGASSKSWVFQERQSYIPACLPLSTKPSFVLGTIWRKRLEGNRKPQHLCFYLAEFGPGTPGTVESHSASLFPGKGLFDGLLRFMLGRGRERH